MEFTLRPLVPIELSGNDVTKSFVALVDSGTDITMMDSEIAEVLGVDLTKARKVTTSGVGGQKPGFLGKVNIQVNGFNEIMTFTVVFVEKLSFDVIFGQDDFFRRFHIKFERDNEVFYLRPTL